MARYDDFDYGEPENRSAAVERHLNRIGISLTTKDKIGGTPDPAQTEQQAKEAKERLARHDKLFNIFPGCAIEDRYKLPRNVSAGDPHEDSRDDRDPELQSLEETRR